MTDETPQKPERDLMTLVKGAALLFLTAGTMAVLADFGLAPEHVCECPDEVAAAPIGELVDVIDPAVPVAEVDPE